MPLVNTFPAPVVSGGLRPPPPPPGVPARSGLDLLDEAFHRLRLAPVGTLAIYYAGTLPFILALLYFCADQSHSPDAATRATSGGLVVTLLFLLMKTCQAVFTAQLSAPLRQHGAAPWTWARLGRLAFVQTLLQPPGLFVLTVASIIAIPLAWVYAFYQNVTVLGDGGVGSVRTTFGRAYRAALRHPKQNHAGLSVLSLLGVFVTLNLVLMAFLVPYLLKMFSGEENLFTRSGAHLLNTTFFAVLFGLLYLVLDPVAKAFYVLRCFYEESTRTGEDLLNELAALPPPVASASALAASTDAAPEVRSAAAGRRVTTGVAAGVILLGLLLLVPARFAMATDTATSTAPTATAAPAASQPAAETRTVSPPALRRSIDDVLTRRKFAWRVPRQDHPEADGALDAFFRNIDQWLHARWVTIKGWASDLIDWIKRWWNPHDPEPQPSKTTGFGGLSGDGLRTLMIVLAATLVGVIAFLSWRQWQAGRAPVVAGKAVATAAPPPDLADDGVLATQLPEDEWLRLAQKLLSSGERRLALRALYLSALSSLAARGLVVIARHKSNRDYLLELRRRARLEPELPGVFGRVVTRFERVWYGSHPADDGLLAEFQADREQLVPAAGAAR